MKLPQSFIDEILARIDLIDIIKSRITLKKTGKVNYSGLCPFHNEKTPSFTANQTKQFYYCFGCKANGNAIGFLMSYEKLTFFEVLEILAAQAGMVLPEQSQHTKESAKFSLNLLEKCARYYQAQLENNTVALNYLSQRGLSREIITAFQLGYAPDGWENLLKAFGKNQASYKQLQEVGMLVQKNNRTAYDRFRDRIMFPIRNKKGQIIAFGGRSLGTNMPKYLNSPESNYFHKSRELYGLYETLQTTKQLSHIIVVEGYLDVIALHQFGITEAVATLGTAISYHHIKILLRHTESLIFCFDGDAAGNAAAWKALEIAFPMMHTGINMHFLFLPTGEDPDSFIRKVGKLGFREKMQEMMPLVEFFFQKLQSETNTDSLSGKTRFVYLAEKYLNKLPQGIFQALMYERLADLLGLNVEKVKEILHTQSIRTQQEIAAPVIKNNLASPLRLALGLLIQRPSLLNDIPLPDDLSSLDLPGMNLFREIIAVIEQHTQLTTGSLLQHFADHNEKALLVELATQDFFIPEETWPGELQGAYARLEELGLENRIQALLEKGKAEGLTDEEKRLLQSLLSVRK